MSKPENKQPFPTDDLQQNSSPIPEEKTAADIKKSRFSPTLKGVMIGAVAGSIVPVLGTFSGAVVGGIAGKLYERKCRKCHA